jgi:hypothetical protein
MECTGIDECEYAEFRFKKVFSSEWIRATGTKGVFAVFDDDTVNYKPSTVDLAAWQMEINDECPQFIYWILTSTKKAFLSRDPNWITSHIGDLQSTWDEVLRHREAGTLPTSSKAVTLDI